MANGSGRLGRGVGLWRRVAACAYVVCAAVSLLATAGAAGGSPPPLGVNGDADWVNLINGIGGWTDPATGKAAKEDANGWPLSDAQITPFDSRHNMPWNGPDPTAENPDISGLYHLSFNGQATISGSTDDGTPVGVINQVYTTATNVTTADISILPNRWFVQLKFANTKRTAASAAGTGFTNMRIIRPGYALKTPQPFTNGSLNAYGPAFSAIRFLGVDGANSYPTFNGASLVQTQWANRVQVTDAYQGGTQAEHANGGAAYGWAWEYMIQLANQTGHDMWINVPISATDDYVTKLATLLKNGDTVNGVTYPGLRHGLHIYVEYSNEVWNFGFPQAVWNQKAAENEVAAGGSNLNNDGNTDHYTWWVRRYVRQVKHISDLFGAVWGASAINTTIRPVALWQYNTEYVMQRALLWLEATYAPGGAHDWLYGIGEAPYYGPYDTSTVDYLFDTLWTGSDSTRIPFIAWQSVAAYFGLKQVGYESGPSLTTGTGGLATRDARMTASEVHHFLDNWFAVGGDEVNFFGLRGSVSPWGDWLLVEDFDHLSTPKMDGAREVLAAERPALTAGSLLPFDLTAAVHIDASQWEQSGQWPGTPQYITPNWGDNQYLLRTNDAAAYSIVLHGHQDSSKISEGIYVDDVLLGTVQMPVGTTDGDSSAVSVTLDKGLHGLRIVYLYNAANGSGRAEPAAIVVTRTSASGSGSVPSAPANPVFTAVGSGTLTLAWAPATTATSYNVYRSLQSGEGYAQIGTSATNSFTDTGLTNGVMYYYVITAVNPHGQSANSPQVSSVPTNTAAPAPPTALQVTMALNGEAALAWSGNSDTAYYRVYRSTTSGSGYSLVSTQFDTHFLDGANGPLGGGGLTNNTTYYYVVTAVNSFGESGHSQQVAAKPVAQVSSAPTSLTATASNGRVWLTWSAPPSLSPTFWPPQYTVYRSGASGGPYSALFSTSVTNGVDVSAVDGQTYYYTVKANNGAGSSGYSAQASATPTKHGAVAIDAGGGATGHFIADRDFDSGSPLTTTAAIDRGRIDHPAPEAVYQSARVAATDKNLTYAVHGLQPGGRYYVKLHFAEIDPSVTKAGERVFDVRVNGAEMLTNLDIFRMTGHVNRALQEVLPVTADALGHIDIEFVHGVAGLPIVNGIEVY